MALAADALISEVEARNYLGVSAEDLPKPALLEQVINGLSRRIIQRTGRTYISDSAEDAASTRQFRFAPDDRVLDLDDCRGISKVEVSVAPNDADSWAEVDADNYVAEPLNEAVTNRLRFLVPAELPAQGSGLGALSLHRQNAADGTPWPRQARAETRSYTVVRVTAKWGYGKDLTTVPANVKLALEMWLQNIHKRDQAFFSAETAEALAKLKMPPDVEEMLMGESSATANVTAV